MAIADRPASTAAPLSQPRAAGLGGLPRRLLRDPMLAFLIAGGAIFLVWWALQARGNEIVVTPAMRQGLAEDRRLLTGRQPTAREQQALVDDWVTDEILFREALARGLHLTDPATKTRLVDRLRFLIAGSPPAPTEAELLDFYVTHPDLYRAEPQISMEQLFFAKTPTDSASVLARLNAGEAVAGDDFWMGRRFPDYGESMLRGMFGEPLLEAARKAPLGVWQGPYTSARGVHFVRVESRRAAQPMPYLAAREQVKMDLMAAQSRAAVARELARVKDRYHVVAAD